MKDLSARTLAVCGGGAIGEALAHKAAALGMRLMRVERKGRGAGSRRLYPV